MTHLVEILLHRGQRRGGELAQSYAVEAHHRQVVGDPDPALVAGVVQAEGACEGNPALRVGTQIRVRGGDPRFDNDYYLTACTHRFDARVGYETDFRAEGAYLGAPA